MIDNLVWDARQLALAHSFLISSFRTEENSSSSPIHTLNHFFFRLCKLSFIFTSKNNHQFAIFELKHSTISIRQLSVGVSVMLLIKSFIRQSKPLNKLQKCQNAVTVVWNEGTTWFNMQPECQIYPAVMFDVHFTTVDGFLGRILCK